jgi:BspA type Leucine rich repeat region (6 copies)
MSLYLLNLRKSISGTLRIFLVAALCFLASNVFADQLGDFTYIDEGATITISDFSESAVGAVLVPPFIVGKPVTKIENNTFDNCAAITSLSIPAEVTSIGSFVFTGCNGLNSISVDSANPEYSSVSGVLFNKSLTSLIYFPPGKSGGYTVPSTIIDIGNEAFLKCTFLTNISIPSNVTTIGNFAFSECTNLSTVSMSFGLSSIGFSAFSFCSAFTSITLPSSITQIPSSIFQGCTALTNISIPSSIIIIGADAFAGCLGLSNIAIPHSVTTIEVGVFSGCANLTSITIDSANTSYSSLDGVLFNKNATLLIIYPLGKNGRYVMPNTVLDIADNAFAQCDLLSGITLSSSLTNIGLGAFFGCDGFTSVTMPPNLTSIQDGAFLSCSQLNRLNFTGNAPLTQINTFPTGINFVIYYFNGRPDFTAPIWRGYQTISMGTETPLKVWLIHSNLPHNSDLKADSNGDGVNLLMAYALNLNPNENLAHRLPQPVLSPTQLGLNYYSGASGVSYRVESSLDLITWSVSGVTTSPPDMNQIRTATVSNSAQKHFMRLVVNY